jgi:hypothetical protein
MCRGRFRLRWLASHSCRLSGRLKWIVRWSDLKFRRIPSKIAAALTGLILLGIPASAHDARWRQLTAATQQFYSQSKYQQAFAARSGIA